jgi:hypothetical protein
MLMFQIIVLRNVFGNVTIFAFFELFVHEHIEFETILGIIFQSIFGGILFYFIFR